VTELNLADTVELLLTGGDARISLDPLLGRNKYSCTPLPEAEVAAFGSSTASSISEEGFQAADRLWRRIREELGVLSGPAIYARELNRVRHELLQLCRLDDLAGIEIVFSSSGTDAHLIATQLVAGGGALPPLVIMMEGDETGKGVPAALNGRHFSSRSALGSSFSEGAPLADAWEVEVVPVPIRQADGEARPVADIHRDVESLATAAVTRGQHVLLILLDQSKTGLMAPTPEYAAELCGRLLGRIDILVDACQFRLTPSTLRGYLEQGFMVALTGSKFLTGPAFSGALILPEQLTSRLRRCRLPGALSAYSARAEWPEGWEATEHLDDAANFGLLLRWEAAMAELRAFRGVPEGEIRRFLEEWASALFTRLQDDPCFQLLPVPEMERGLMGDPAGWDHVPTIFSFLPCRPGVGGEQLPLSSVQTQEVYRLLQCDLSGTVGAPLSAGLRCQLGQPVACGTRDGVALSALRICTSSRLIVEAFRAGNSLAIRQRLMAALDKAAWLITTGI
jgi:hypothetical protein